MRMGTAVRPWLLSDQIPKYQKCSSSLGFQAKRSNLKKTTGNLLLIGN